jgi:hypothetical protein
VAVGWQGTILQSGNLITLTIAAKLGTDLLTLSLEGPIGMGYTIQSSTDLRSWRDVAKFTSTESSKIVFENLPAHSDHLFYRAFSP